MILAQIATLAAAGLLVPIAWQDLKTLKIRNPWVLAMLALYLLRSLGLGGAMLTTDLLAGGVLFAIGLVMWLLRAMGAGDAKLMLPLGMFLGLDGLAPFCVLLLAVSILMFLAIRLAQWIAPASGPGHRLAEMGRSGKVAYGLVLALSAGPVMLVRALWFT